MGVGFAAFVAASDADRCVTCAKNSGYDAWIGGTVIKDQNRKAVEIIPLGLTYEADTLKLR
jgi:phosphoribosylformylglycinamidine cyclo-ligase